MNSSDEEPPRLEEMLLLLDAYLAGDARPEDVTVLREWLAADPAREKLLEDLRKIREVASSWKQHRSADVAWQRMLPILKLELSRHSGDAPPPMVPPPPPPPVDAAPRRFATRSRIGAAVVAVAGVAAAAVALMLPTRNAVAPDVAIEPTRYATARGQLTEARLPDGSRVWLGPESRLSVEPSGDSSRNVVLEGEAYFDVAQDDERPFTVRAQNAVVRDLGTRFAVRAYAHDRRVRVLVTQGKVELTSDSAAGSPGTMLVAGMIGRVNSMGVISAQSGVDTSQYLDFTRGQIVLVATPLRDAVRELERWYDIDIHLADSTMGDRRITATIADQTLPELLEQLSIALNVRVSRSPGSAVLSDKPMPKRAY